MQVLDRTGVGTLWSICKTKFALAGHTHNSLAAVGAEQISATAYGSGLHFKPYYSSGGPTTYGNILEYTSTNTGGGQLAMEWTSSQKESDGTDSHVGRVYYRSKRDNMNGWTKWMTLAYTNDIPTRLSQLTNDKGFVTGSVSGNTVTINGASTTWTNTWRGIQDNLTSTSTSESLSANQGRVLKGLVDGKANSSHTHSWSQISEVPTATTTQSGIMSAADKAKLNGIASGANNYSLPVSSNTTLGGIKVSMPAQDTGTRWPIILDNNGVVYTSINGLNKNNLDGSVENVIVKNNKYSTTYSSTKIQIRDMSQNKSALLDFPAKSGIFALLSDIPDASNLCRFNFVNSISECKSDRINFLIFNEGYTINIDTLNDSSDGIILFIFSKVNVYINNKSRDWYHGEYLIQKGINYILSSGHLLLITTIEGTVHTFSFN